mgnify:CR=1 FL=1
MQRDNGKLSLFLTHRAALVDYAAPIVGCRSRAEDVVQDAYLRFAGRTTDDDLRQPLAYLYRVVRNTALDCVRRLSAEARRDAVGAAATDGEPLVPSPEETLMHRDSLRRIETALAELPIRTRLAFELHRFGGLTFHQIADRLGISTATAHRLTRDAMVSVMRGQLDDEP